jgi:hypothetical protein
MKKSNSGQDFKINDRSIEKTVGFHDKLLMNNSFKENTIGNLEEEADYGSNLLDNDKSGEWYKDFLNLAFGNDKETEEFYIEVVFPRISTKFDFPLEKLLRYEINFTALYYSLIYHCGIRVVDEQDIFPRLGKSNTPFLENNVIRCYTRYKVYPMRNLPVHHFSNKYKEYRAQGQNELAMQACKAKIHYIKLLEDVHDIDTQGEIAELLVEEEMYDEAIEQAAIGLKN